MKESIDKRLKILHILTEEQTLILFEDIYNEYYKLAFYIISKYINNYDDICDLVNDCFLNIYKNIKNIRKNVKYYIVVTSKNAAINFLKKQNNIILDNDFIYNQKYEQQDKVDYNYIYKILNELLSKEEIEIIELHLLYNKKFREIAKFKKQKEQTIKTTYYRAIKKVKEKSDINE